MSEARAIIRWLSEGEGGRARPPANARGYSTVSRFFSHYDEFDKVAWSLRIIDAIELHGPEVIEATIAFLHDNAPHQWLTRGERFELREGRKVVARGVVLPPDAPVPERISEFELALLA